MKTFLLVFLSYLSCLSAEVKLGVDVFFEEGKHALLKGKKVGLLTNQSAINSRLKSTLEIVKEHEGTYQLVLLFAPEHGFFGSAYACDEIEDTELNGIPIFGLHGKRRRPTSELLEKIDVILFDVQDIGARSYSYASTLFYCMEEAAKAGKEVIVLDRPNPMGGMVVDGPLLEEKWRSFLGYINVPYCHGMTIGELAALFNGEYRVGCKLTVIPMKGWKRGATFADAKLTWVPTSPQIPEWDTPFYYSTTGLIGHCSITNIGVGYTLPFKLIGAPWMDSYVLARTLNAQMLPGVFFPPFPFRPFFGKFKEQICHGVRIIIQDPKIFLPVTTQYTIMGVLKNLYPKYFNEALAHLVESKSKKETFNKLNGGEEILRILREEPYFIWKLRQICKEAAEKFQPIRKKYLNPAYEPISLFKNHAF